MLMKCADCGGTHNITYNDAGLFVRLEPCPADSKQDKTKEQDDDQVDISQRESAPLGDLSFFDAAPFSNS